MQHSTTDFVSLPVRTNEHDSNFSFGSRRPRKDDCLQLMDHLKEAQLHRGVLVVELKAML